jgi:hypothetical protein
LAHNSNTGKGLAQRHRKVRGWQASTSGKA